MKKGDHYFTITHKVVPSSQTSIKTYWNYMVEYDANLNPVRISKPFKLTDSNIEFVTEMKLLPDNEILIGVTENDAIPRAMVFDLDVLNRETG